MDHVFPYIEGLFKVTCGILAFFGVRILNRIDDDMKRISASIDAQERDLMAHKLHVEQSFEHKDTVQASLSRIHDRMDEIFNVLLDIKRKQT